MATIKPFSAIRPTPQYVSKVAALPYDVMSTEEAKKMVEGNPYSFLHIDKPEIFLKNKENEDNPIQYEYAKEYLRKLIDESVLVQDGDDCYYIYELQNDKVRQRGIVGCASVREYEQGIIKKHENTRADKEVDRIRHVDTCSAHTGPIFLAYRENNILRSIIQTYVDTYTPVYYFQADDGVTHTIWKVKEDIGIEIEIEFQKIESLYIADGHHRAAAAVAVANRRKEEDINYDDNKEYNYFLAVAFDETELCIMDYNRVVKDLNNRSINEFLELVSENFIIEEINQHSYAPNSKGSFGMYYSHQWYVLKAKSEIATEDVVESLDVSILQNYILNPILGVEEPRTDERIEFIGGIRGLQYLQQVADQYNGIAFSMFPTSIQQLMEVADQNKLMPPKSTWFEPKLRSGLFIHQI